MLMKSCVVTRSLKDKYVIVTDEELERLAPEKTRDIDSSNLSRLIRFRRLYFERGYFLTPAAGSQKAYKLLAETMEKSGARRHCDVRDAWQGISGCDLF